MVGQRVTDLLAIIRALPALIGPRRIVLAARGSLTVPAVMAAALEPAVSQTYLCDGLRSYRSILDTEHYPQPFANFLFDLARETDLPEIEALCGPRRVIAGTRWTVEALSTRG